MGGGDLQESNHRRASSGKRSGHIYSMEDNLLHASYAMCSSMLLLKFFAYFKEHTEHIEQRDQRMCQSGRLRVREVKNSGKSLNFQAQKVVVVAHRR